MWISKFGRFTAYLEDVTRQKAHLAQGYNWSKIENLPKPDQLIFKTWNALPNMHEKVCTWNLVDFWIHTHMGETCVQHELSTLNTDIAHISQMSTYSSV